MLVILMRHGIAEDTVPDEARVLTPAGRERTEQMAALLKKLGLRPDALFTSPRARALQTAEIVAHAFKLKTKTTITDALDFGASWNQFAALLVDPPATGDKPPILLLAGHQPHLGIIATIALAGDPIGMELRKGSCLGLRFPGPITEQSATLEFYLTPRLARGEF